MKYGVNDYLLMLTWLNKLLATFDNKDYHNHYYKLLEVLDEKRRITRSMVHRSIRGNITKCGVPFPIIRAGKRHRMNRFVTCPYCINGLTYPYKFGPIKGWWV